MPPLGNTVGFIDGKKGNFYILKPLQKRLGHQPFRRHVKQVESIIMHLRQHLPGLRLGQRRVVEGRLHTIGLQGIHLVLHQGNER